MNDDNVVVINEGIKKRGRGGKYNFPSTVEPEDKDDVRAALTNVLKWSEIGQREKAVTVEDFRNRTIAFFQGCLDSGERPTWEKYCLALGHPRQTVWSWVSGERTKESAVVDIIKNAKDMCASYDADMVSAGKLNPVTWIFRAKNYYSMKDQTDIVVAPQSGLASDVSPDEIAAKYAELPGD